MKDLGAYPALAKAEPVARLGPSGFDPGELRYRKRLADEEWNGRMKDVELRRGPYAGD